MANDVVVVSDLDKTISDCDSDNWVVDELSFNELFTHLLPLNSLTDRMMMGPYSQGKTIHDTEECLKRIPIDTAVISAIKSAYAFGCDLRILLSNTNVFLHRDNVEATWYFGVFQRNQNKSKLC